MTPFGPGGAPREGIRPWIAGFAALGVLAIVPLMFSDRAPAVLDRFSDSIERSLPDFYRFTLKPKLPLPEADLAVHLVVFSTAAFVVGLVCWSWRTFVVGQLLVFGAGALIEILQPLVTSSRDIEVHDMIGNTIGQALGIVVALVAFGSWALWDGHRTARADPTPSATNPH